MSGQTVVAAMVEPGVTDETLKTWGKEISDKQGTKEPLTLPMNKFRGFSLQRE